MQRKIEEPLKEVRKWKKEVSASTSKMTPEEVVRYFRKESEGMWRKHGYRCIEIDNKSCKHLIAS